MTKLEFEKIRKQLNEFEEKRESLIQLSRKTISLSKKIIYSLHANNEKEASNYLEEIKKLAKQVQGNYNYDLGMAKVAVQEYVEAIAYYEYITTGKLLEFSKLGIDIESYLLGLCDLSGELVRRAVNKGIEGDKDEIIKIKKFVEEIYAEFLTLELRNSDLRHKADSLYWNLKKLEDILFTLKTR
jgi:translin